MCDKGFAKGWYIFFNTLQVQHIYNSIYMLHSSVSQINEHK